MQQKEGYPRTKKMGRIIAGATAVTLTLAACSPSPRQAEAHQSPSSSVSRL